MNIIAKYLTSLIHLHTFVHIKTKQLKLLSSENSAYGGVLLNTRKGRSRGRPLAVKNSMHLVLRSTKAKGAWSFRRTVNRSKIETIINKFARKYGVRILSIANVGNHLHLNIQLGNRFTFKPFIRAITSAIAMAITGLNRWTKKKLGDIKFWDYRPYSRIVIGWRVRLKPLLCFKFLGNAIQSTEIRAGRLVMEPKIFVSDQNFHVFIFP